MKIGIGIDTGGTCTDAVAYDFESGALLAKGKALTTRDNLSIGIGRALDKLPEEYIRRAGLVALSTTLATNACVENKGCRGKLLIFGLTDELLRRFKADENYGLNLSDVRCIDTNSSADGLIIDEPDWDMLFSEHGLWLSDADALSAAELYASSNGAVCEKKFKSLVRQRLDLQCVCANELTDRINTLARGATALLNSRLFPIVQEFIQAAKEDFARRGCTAPIMVVRSDGSLMSAEFSLEHPVETIISGPAASILAGKAFSSDDNYIIVDMGGTTTDVSIVRDGKPVIADKGIHIGPWRTSINGVFVDTFGLGGDSGIRAENGALTISGRRALPLCSAAVRWPGIKDELEALLQSRHTNRYPLHEFLYLVKEPPSGRQYDDWENRLIAALRRGPCCLDNLSERAGIDIYHLNSERLESEGVIMRCGLTPTDFMHIRGDYSEFDREASVLAARYLLICLGREDTADELMRLAKDAYDLVGETMYCNLVRILLSQEYPEFSKGLDNQTASLIRRTWAMRSIENAPLSHCFSTSAALIGMGAPTHVFLPEVARALHTKCVIPENAEVANAIGALRADILSVVNVEISQRIYTGGDVFYIVHAPGGSRRFVNLDDAIDCAKAAAKEAAVRDAVSKGASGALRPTIYLKGRDGGNNLTLGGTVTAEVSAAIQ